MALLLLFAFLAGVVTILSPCVLPLLPIILSSSDASGRQKPFGVVLGFVGSFTFFTLFLSTIVRLSGISADALRSLSVFILLVFGASLLIPSIQQTLEKLLSRLSRLAPSTANHTGFTGGLFIGASLGLLWTPCVGPILASVISLALTGTVSTQAFFITTAYALGTAIPLFLIMMAGSTALQRVPWLTRHTAHIQKAFGVLMIATAIGIALQVDRRFQSYILTTFPQYGVGLTQLEDNQLVRQQLSNFARPQDMPAPEITAGGEWFNTMPLQLRDLRGKVVLIDFWTYSCINCQRTLPYLRSWWGKYRDDGLVVIGVHSPEFEFEKNPRNVQQAIDDFQISYPVVQDNNFSTWKAYRNQYWPAKYLVDKDGKIRYTHFGEGKYDETERMIQQLLRESGADVSAIPVENPTYTTFGRTPELYLGARRMEYLVSPEAIHLNAPVLFSAPQKIPLHRFAYVGTWNLTPEYAAPSRGAQLQLHFEAKEVFLVARPKNGKTGSFRVLIDNQEEGTGEDVQDGIVTVAADRLYKLVRLPQAGVHTLTIEFTDENVEVYAFTFG